MGKTLTTVARIIGIILAIPVVLFFLCVMTHEVCGKPDTKFLCSLIGLCK